MLRRASKPDERAVKRPAAIAVSLVRQRLMGENYSACDTGCVAGGSRRPQARMLTRRKFPIDASDWQRAQGPAEDIPAAPAEPEGVTPTAEVRRCRPPFSGGFTGPKRFSASLPVFEAARARAFQRSRHHVNNSSKKALELTIVLIYLDYLAKYCET